MNPFEGFIIVFSCVLLVSLLSVFFRELIIDSVSVIDGQDLRNLVNIYERGVLLNVSFSVVYNPLRSGFLNVTDGLVFLNNASLSNPGLQLVSCNYSSLIIDNRGISCA